MADRVEPAVLHLLRHAHAGDSTTWDGPDALRPLTKRGRRQSDRLGRFLVTGGVRPDAIVSSPKVRARQAADIVAEHLGLEVVEDQRLADGYDLVELERIAGSTGVRAPMLVGHDPDLSFALAELCGGGNLAMRKGALATLDVRLPLRPGSGMLRWLVPPDLLGDD